MRTVWSLLAVGSTVVALVACSRDDDSSDESAPPVPSATMGSTVESSDPTTTESTTTAPESTTSELNPVPTPPEVSLPPTTTAATVELPPVPTLVPQVPAELLTPEQLDPFSVDNSRPILPEHVPILDAYLRALQASNHVASTWPIDPDSPELIASPLTPESLELDRAALRDRLELGQVLNVEQGITFRPYVAASVTGGAVLLDCEFAGHYWMSAESGELVPPDDIWPAGPGRIVEVGVRYDMVFRDGQWLVGDSRIDPGACA